MKISKFEIFRPFLGAAAAAVALVFLPVATYSTVISDTLTADETKLTASDGAPFDQFGISVSLSGDTAVVGASGDNPFDSGSAYVFENQGGTWVEVAKLTASDGAAGDDFGLSVSVSGDTAVVGAWLDDDNGTNSGSAYVFENLGGVWVEVAKLTASDGAVGDEFGRSVSLSGNTAVVGASQDDDNGFNSGSAYVFENLGGVWVEVAKLAASDGAAGNLFGWSVSVSGNTTVVGAIGDDDNGTLSGSAYVFENLGGAWVEVAKLIASAVAADDRFGWSVSVYADTAVIGTRRSAHTVAPAAHTGFAYVFEKVGGAWAEMANLFASDGSVNDIFSVSVSVSGNTAVIGAFRDDDNGFGSGSAYVFEHTGDAWIEVAKLTASDGAAFDFLGESVSVSGDTAVLGANGDDDNGSNSGSAWVFEFPEPTPGDQTDNLIASVEDLVAEGSLSSGAGTSLIKQLENALKSLDKGNDNAAIKQLAAFANQVQALIDGGLLTEEEGLPLIDAALSTIDQILAG